MEFKFEDYVINELNEIKNEIKQINSLSKSDHGKISADIVTIKESLAFNKGKITLLVVCMTGLASFFFTHLLK